MGLIIESIRNFKQNNSKDGVDCSYIANKIIAETQRVEDEHTIPIYAKRLVRLVMLSDVMYFQNFKQPLIKQGYKYWGDKYGYVIPQIFNRYPAGDMRPDHVDGLMHKDFEILLSTHFVDVVDDIVKRVVDYTKYTDVIDLIDLVKVPVPYEILAKYKYYENNDVPKEMFYAGYLSFDFQQLKTFNEKEFERISNKRGSYDFK